jgi:hypothetical protein
MAGVWEQDAAGRLLGHLFWRGATRLLSFAQLWCCEEEREERGQVKSFYFFRHHCTYRHYSGLLYFGKLTYLTDCCSVNEAPKGPNI